MEITYGRKYDLTDSDQEIIKNMNDIICNQKREYFVENFKVDKNMELSEMNMNGFGAELAFCRLCGVEFDSSTNEKENHFVKVDCTLPDGRTVDVKTTIYRTGKLLARTGKKDTKVDLFALMIGKFPSFEFRGWATFDMLIDENNLKDLGYGEGYALEQHQLNLTLKSQKTTIND